MLQCKVNTAILEHGQYCPATKEMGMIGFIKKLLYPFTAEAEFAREQRAMHAFLSQAVDRYHLEYLEREWEQRRNTIIGY